MARGLGLATRASLPGPRYPGFATRALLPGPRYLSLAAWASLGGPAPGVRALIRASPRAPTLSAADATELPEPAHTQSPTRLRMLHQGQTRKAAWALPATDLSAMSRFQRLCPATTARAKAIAAAFAPTNRALAGRPSVGFAAMTLRTRAKRVVQSAPGEFHQFRGEQRALGRQERRFASAQGAQLDPTRQFPAGYQRGPGRIQAVGRVVLAQQPERHTKRWPQRGWLYM